MADAVPTPTLFSENIWRVHSTNASKTVFFVRVLNNEIMTSNDMLEFSPYFWQSYWSAILDFLVGDEKLYECLKPAQASPPSFSPRPNPKPEWG